MSYSAEDFNQMDAQGFSKLLGMKSVSISKSESICELHVKPELLAVNGFLHAGVVVTLADTTAGYGCMANLPEGATGFTTIELKSNFIGTARRGKITATAKCIHAGRTTQVWDATVQNDDGKTIAEFRCTELILHPK